MSVPPLVIICGVRQTGKTTLTKNLTNQAGRVMVYDSAMQFQDPRDNFTSVYQSPSSLKANISKDGSFRVAYVPKDKRADLDYFCKLAEWAGDVTVIFDDCGAYCSPNMLPDGIEDLVRYSGHKNISLVLSTHLPKDFNDYVFSQASNIFCFHNESELALKKIRENTGDAVSLERLKTLPLFTALHYSRATWRWEFVDNRHI